MSELKRCYHFYPSEKWMNDPNGLVHYEGEYHMFYQCHPYNMNWDRPMHWGHAISRDLINWEQYPIALYADELGDIFSGSAVVDWKDRSGFFNGSSGLVAIFTHATENCQSQSISYSSDKGRTWIKYAGNPVIKNPGLSGFRDPKVFWYQPHNKWVMVVTCGDRVGFYASVNLKEWELLSNFGQNEGAHGGGWECPDLFELPVDGNEINKKWVLKVDVFEGAVAGGSGSQYFIGDFDGHTFSNNYHSQEVNWTDFGKDFYAAQSFSDIQNSDGRRIWIGWMNNWKYANHIPAKDYRGTMTVPRKVELKSLDNGKIKVVQTPVNEIEKLRCELYTASEQIVLPGINILDGIEGQKVEIIADIDLLSATEFGFIVRKSFSQKTVIGYNGKRKEVFVDRRLSGNKSFSDDFEGVHSAAVDPIDGKIKLHILLDETSVEVFCNDGIAVITDLIFPDNTSVGTEFYSTGSAVKINSIYIYNLNV
ncbi:MAG TPA: glycoside hydrolase family 32 protein [Ruminiclostridium sp.]